MQKPKKQETIPRELFPVQSDYGDNAKLTASQIHFLINWARSYGLDAWAGHVCFYRGKPYVTIDGHVAKARAEKDYRGYETRCLSQPDKESLGYNPLSSVWQATVHIEGYQAPIVEYGEVSDSELEELQTKHPDKARFLPVVKHPGLMAEKRALARALSRAFPIGVRTYEEVSADEPGGEYTVSEEEDRRDKGPGKKGEASTDTPGHGADPSLFQGDQGR